MVAMKEMKYPDGYVMEAVQKAVARTFKKHVFIPHDHFLKALNACVKMNRIEKLQNDRYKIYVKINTSDVAELIVEAVRVWNDPNGTSAEDIQKFAEEKLARVIPEQIFRKGLNICVFQSRKIEKAQDGTYKLCVPLSCSHCRQHLRKEKFSEAEQTKGDLERICYNCIKACVKEEQTRLLALPRKCTNCDIVKEKNQYSIGQWNTCANTSPAGTLITEKDVVLYQQKCLGCLPVE
jgi:hypothetical protein